jgi:predicted RNA binding protein YcfA (HicA-like mRNA interferase family)
VNWQLPKLTPVSWNVLVKRLNKLGFEGPYSGGKHPFMVKNDLVLTIPNPHKAVISVDLLSRILRQAKISREEWLNN